MTVDSARKATPPARASSANATPCRATGHLFDVTTGICRPSASRMCPAPGSPSSRGLDVTSTSTSASVASRPSSALGQWRTPGSPVSGCPVERSRSTDGRSSPRGSWTKPSRALATPTTFGVRPYRLDRLPACASSVLISQRPTVPRPTTQMRTSFTSTASSQRRRRNRRRPSEACPRSLRGAPRPRIRPARAAAAARA